MWSGEASCLQWKIHTARSTCSILTTFHFRNGSTAPAADYHGSQFPTQNLKYAIDFGALPNVGGVQF